MLKNKTKLKYIFFFIALFFLYFFVFQYTPYGFFCDEAEIGRSAYLLLQGQTSHLVGPFFYQHFNYILGALPVYATLPFVALFGLTEFAVRGTSYFFALLTIILVFLTLRKMKAKHVFLPTLIFAFTPIFFHISRINFGHYPSLFFVILGYYFYIGFTQAINDKKKASYLAVLGGICFGLSIYGYSSFILTTFVFTTAIVVTRLHQFYRHKRSIKNVLLMYMVILLFYIPTIFTAFTSPDFFNRLRDKNAGQPLLTSEKIQAMAANYPKYFGYSFLFAKGEIHPPQTPLSRHSIQGNGVLFSITFPLIAFSILAWLFGPGKNKALYAPFFISILGYPLPDLISTQLKNPPYTFSLFPSIILVPFILSYFFESLQQMVSNRLQKISVLIIFILVFFESITFFSNYSIYPLYASDYWGWQSGAREIVEYFKKESRNYDEVYLSVYFNQPGALIAFYDPERSCSNCMVGGLDRLDNSKKQLFALQTFELPANRQFKIKKTIYYPGGKEAFYIGEFTR